MISRYRRRQPKWAVNGLAVSALPELLSQADLRAWSAAVRSLRAQLVGVLRRHGLEPQPSDANWVLVEAPGLRPRLAPYGVVVRDCTSFGLPDMVRIAVPGPRGLERLDEALASIMKPLVGAKENGAPKHGAVPNELEVLPQKGES